MSEAKGSITRDGAFVVIRVPVDRVHGLQVALAPCPCKSPKSNSTAKIRADLAQGLAKAMSK